jgi:hypothetical protein
MVQRHERAIAFCRLCADETASIMTVTACIGLLSYYTGLQKFIFPIKIVTDMI